MYVVQQYIPSVTLSADSVEVGDPLLVYVSAQTGDSLFSRNSVLAFQLTGSGDEHALLHSLSDSSPESSNDTAIVVESMPLDEGVWNVSGILLVDSTHIPLREPLSQLVVRVMDVDTTQSMQDIHKPYDGEFNLLHYWPEGLAVLGALALVVGAIVFARKRAQEPQNEISTPPVDPAAKVLERLNSVKERDLARTASSKTFFSEVSFALREYIEAVFDIPALEQTTDELKHAVQYHPAFTETVFQQLAELGMLADAVKFAKHETTAEQNIKQLQAAYSIAIALQEYVQRQNSQEDKHA